MNIIAYKCLNSFHRRFVDTDSNPELNKLSAFKNLIQGDDSGENLFSKIIDTDEYWENMLDTRGFGRGVKYDKAQAYRKGLKTTWDTIIKTFNSKNEIEISKLMGSLLWDMKENEFCHSYLGVIEKAIKLNKLWKNPLASEIFCSYYNFVKGNSKTQEEIAEEHNLAKERIRQLKEQYLQDFDKDFWFLKDDLFKDKLKKLFNLNKLNIEQLKEQTEEANKVENVQFTQEFYTYILSVCFDLILVGNINDIKNKIKKSSRGNIWSNLYLQTQDENKRCNLKLLIDDLAIEMYDNNYRFEKDKVIFLTRYVTTPLSPYEIERYTAIISLELECETEVYSDRVVIKRNSIITQPEMVEIAMKELGGFAYTDDILKKLIEIYPEKDWTMPMLRASFRGDNFYSVGKSGLFGLVNVKDIRAEMGNGTLNDIISKYMSQNDSPIHIYALLEHINNLFPRPKTLRSVNTILEQNSRAYFKKFDGGFYGLKNKSYKNTVFQSVVGGHGLSMKKIIEDSSGIKFEDVFRKFNLQYGLLEIQVRYLLNLMIESKKISLIDGLYHSFIPEITKTDKNDNLESSVDEITVELNPEELSIEELDQPDVPNLIGNFEAQIKIRRGQPKFRQQLLKLYNETCIITGCKIKELLEAAHILPYSMRSDYKLSNGLLLRADIHTLFDLGMIAIDPENMCLKLSDILMESNDYKHLNNIDIGSKLIALRPNYKISEEGLRWRWRNFIESE
ncbi:MAG: HNH endonuclease [Spirosomataceae bacterium]